MGIQTLRRHHDDAGRTTRAGVVSAVDGEKTAETLYSPAKPSKEAGIGADITKGKKTPQKAVATPGNGVSE